MKTYPCPTCGTAVEARGDYLARGMKCPSCQTGFIPEKIELRREIGLKAGAGGVGGVWAVVVLVVLACIGGWAFLGVSPIFTVLLAIVALLAGISFQLAARRH